MSRVPARRIDPLDPRDLHARASQDLAPTPLGLASPQMQLGDTPAESESIWPKLPPLYWLLEISSVKPAARVLAEHPTRSGRTGQKLPAILLHYVGAGVCLVLAGLTLYELLG